MRYTARDLNKFVEEVNKQKGLTKNGLHLKVLSAYGGHQVCLTGGRLGSGCKDVTYGYQSPRDAKSDLLENDFKGYLDNNIKFYK